MPPHGGLGSETVGPPRLTTYLRYYTNIAQKPEPVSEYDAAQILQQKREEHKRQARENGISWTKIKSDVEKLGKEKNVNIDFYLREVFEVAKLVSPEPDVRNEMASILFTLFHDQEYITNHSKIRIRQLAGEVKNVHLERCHKAIRTISELIEEDNLIALIKSLQTVDNAPRFGANIKVGPVCQKPVLKSSDKLLNFEKLRPVSNASLKYEDYATTPEPKEQIAPVKKREVYDKLWIETEMKKYYADINMIPELSNGAHTLLLTSKSNEELQNELFDFLGFERFELIQNLLEKRSLIKNPPVDKVQKMNELLSTLEKATEQPAFAQQVKIMSDTEKQFLKQARREEKKLLRTAKQVAEDDTIEDFNPEELRSKREMALLEASRAYLFKRPTRSAAAEVNYPYVFDNHSKARSSAGFIAGLKMALPEGFQRSTDDIKEEVEIPINDPVPPEIGSKFIPISDLDDIGQVAFKGCKTLNRIQSIVYPAAYHTNENLLICAPTGAGKTNIAMLTVIHAIRNHLEDNVIQKDKFKIVYIAPMKALAAEMARNFGKRLELLGLIVRELTGDMHLTKQEIMNTNMIITTPEKWDVTTRKPGDTQLSQLVKLLIIDEVHLLHGDRGPVLETIVARTLRMVESQQSMIRIVGLSATLPNYIDVARFLRVDPYKGLFFFDGRFRPVPLGLTFTGIRAPGRMKQMEDMDRVAYEKCLHFIDRGHQVMIFVHARNGTLRTAENLIRIAQEMGDTKAFMPEDGPEISQALKNLGRSRNKKLLELFENGFSVHHAGLLRQDRNLIESLFSKGLIKVLVCTATLAWGVNLPAHAVIIKGTDIYDSKHGQMVDLGILDVLQIFGRAGRPQFDTSGHGTIITTHDKLSHYLALLTNQYPIESSFINHLADNLNAEIALGNVTNIEEAVEWLSYTYLYVRMRKNPQVYGILYKELQNDEVLHKFRSELLVKAARALDKAHMVRFDEANGYLGITDMGRIASQFYIKFDTVEVFNEFLKTVMNESDILALVSQSSEFSQLKIRDEEISELDELHNQCEVAAKGGVENIHGKVNILLQSYISRVRVEGFSLISDMNYICDNSGRITRALFEIVLHKNWSLMASRLLIMAKMMEHQLWDCQCPLRQFKRLSPEILDKIENSRLTIEKMRDMDHREIGKIIRHERMGKEVKSAAWQFPLLQLDAVIQPITRTVLRINLSIFPDFRWNDKIHGNCEIYWIWVEDPNTNFIYHREQFTLTKKQVIHEEEQKLVFTIPIFEPLPSQYYVRAVSDKWLGCDSSCTLSFRNLILPERHPPNTDLLDLEPLPITALNDSKLEMLYKFTHFNPIQTQIFFCLYHTDENVLLGAPTGSGKTIAAEIAMFKVFREQPDAKVVYIAPLKALVRERVIDWKARLGENLNKNVVELTGDITPDIKSIQEAHLIITTPEKWDGISRSWQTRNYVKKVALIIIDEIHLLGEDRGPVLEVIVSRTNFICSHTNRKLRIIGLSTALANAKDLGDWLGIKEMGLYNFRPSVRPVHLEVHIAGFPGKHYCPRMATMNKPTFQAIKQHSPEKPVLVFVSSRRQTRLTALDLVSFVVTDPDPKQWLHMPEHEMDQIQSRIKDENLRLCLSFGVGLHHAGLHEKDRKIVEELFVNQKIQILITTATLAWGVNFPAHLVVVKGTEFYDGKTKRYVDFPITDVLQMMGRAGRPQFDTQGVAVILVHDLKKHFYKKFLYEPFPVESSLLNVLPDHINAEIVANTINSKQEALDYLTWTYFFRRLVQNPTYYGLDIDDSENGVSQVNPFLSRKIDLALEKLETSQCIIIEEDNRTIQSTTLGKVASFYYLSHLTVRMFSEELRQNISIEELLKLLTEVQEYAELPVRHNEDLLNEELAKSCPIEVDKYTYESPHTKAHLLLQSHMSHLPLPCVDYLTDTKSVLDQALRILQAMLDVCASASWLNAALEVITLLQMVTQARWHTDSTILTLPHLESHMLYCFKYKGRNITHLPELVDIVGNNYETLASMVRDELEESKIETVFKTLRQLPILNAKLTVTGGPEEMFINPNIYANDSTRKPGDWIKLQSGESYTVSVMLSRENKTRDLRVVAPKFSKSKDEGWILVLGNSSTSELMGIKRIGSVRDYRKHSISFDCPMIKGKMVLILYIMSDGYLGLDQQYEIPIEVVTSDVENFVNSEVILDFNYQPPPIKKDKTYDMLGEESFPILENTATTDTPDNDETITWMAKGQRTRDRKK